MASAGSGKKQWGDQLPGHKATQVNIDRHEAYGDPTPNMEMFAMLLNGLLWEHLKKPITAEDGCQIMVLLKVMREKQSGYSLDYEDNRVDVAGWTNVLHQVVASHASA